MKVSDYAKFHDVDEKEIWRKLEDLCLITRRNFVKDPDADYEEETLDILVKDFETGRF